MGPGRKDAPNPGTRLALLPAYRTGALRGRLHPTRRPALGLVRSGLQSGCVFAHWDWMD